MDNGRLAINDTGIDTLVRELDIKGNDIDEKIAQIQNIYSKLDDYCIGAKMVSSDFTNNLAKARETIEYNIASYAADLKTLQDRLHDSDNYLANLFNQAALEQKDKNDTLDTRDLIGDNKKGKEI